MKGVKFVMCGGLRVDAGTENLDIMPVPPKGGFLVTFWGFFVTFEVASFLHLDVLKTEI